MFASANMYLPPPIRVAFLPLSLSLSVPLYLFVCASLSVGVPLCVSLSLCRVCVRLCYICAGRSRYLTPPTTRAFDPHFDLEDTVIQQLSGSKTWRIWSPSEWPVAMPLRSQTEGRNAAPPREAPCFTLTLEPGDVLYVPRGHSHVAVPVDSSAGIAINAAKGPGKAQQGPPSVHLTNTLHVQEFTVRRIVHTATQPPSATHVSRVLLLLCIVGGHAAAGYRDGR